MSVSNPTSNVEHGLGEPRNQRDARIEELWMKLDPDQRSELDLVGLRDGLKRIDHPMQNADDMLKQILNEVDTNKDGKIQYQEFREFVERAEVRLHSLFNTIDKDMNGKLDKRELQAAFSVAGLKVSSQRLNDFFADLDIDNDGYVGFEEWRDFLLFMPAPRYGSQLKAVMSYYNSVVSVTPEGDSIVSEEVLEGLGTISPSRSLLYSAFGALFRVAFPWGHIDSSSKAPIISSEERDAGPNVSPGSAGIVGAREAQTRSTVYAAKAEVQLGVAAGVAPEHVSDGAANQQCRRLSTDAVTEPEKKFVLIDFIPDPGYFLAGAVAGGVSRTTTAPLDRLKVYLLVNTSNKPEEALGALQRGRPFAALRNAVRPLSDALKDLLRTGGVRSLFAGNGLNVVKIMPETAIKFGSYEAAKRALANLEGHGDPRRIETISKFTAGGLAGMIAQFCVYPLDTLKFRLQCETVKDGLTGTALLRQTATKMYADGGLRACYRGVVMGLVGMFPYSALDMGMFELLKKTYRQTYAKYTGCSEDDANPGNIATGIIGASSGAFGATMVYPLNVVRTRLQTQGTIMHSATYTGIWDVAQKTIQKEGYRGFYKGLTPNILKVAPALSITWVVYENSKRVLGLP